MAETDAEMGDTIQAGSIATNVHDRGSGEPVLLLHGSGPGVSAWANWRLNIPAFEERFRVIAPDIVGFGFTERPAGIDYNMDTWVGHLEGILEALDLEEVTIVGNSFGGALGLLFACTSPSRVKRLVLMGSGGVDFELTPGLDAVWGYTPSVENMRKLLDIFAFNRELVTDELAELRYKASIRPGVQEAYAQMFPEPRQQWIESMIVPEEDLRGLQVPTLIVHGREDDVTPPENSRRLFDLIPRSELHMFGQCGHWTQIEHRERFNALVTDFVLATG